MRRTPGLVLVGLLLAAACDQPGTLVLADWQLEVPGRAAEPIQLPAHPAVPDAAPSFRLRATVLLPPALRGRPLTLTLGAVQAQLTARAGGREAIALDASSFDRYRTRGWQAWRVPPAPGPSLELELEVANTWGSSAWLDDAPRLSASERGDRRYLATSAWSEWTGGATAAILLVLTAIYLVTFLIDRRQRAEGWFACVTASILVVTLFMQGLTQPLLGVADGPVAMAAVTVASLCSVHFVHAHFSLAPPHRAWLLTLPLLAAVEILWHDRFSGIRVGVPILAALWFAVIGYQVALLVWLRRTRRPAPRHSGALLVCWIVTAAAGALWMLPWLAVGPVMAGTLCLPAGFGFYAVVQSIAISRDRAAAAVEAERLTGELEDRVAELERRERELDALNSDLRSQIAARSGRLSQALASLAPLSAALDRAGDRAWALGIAGALAASLAELHASGAGHGRIDLESIFLDHAGRPVLPPARAGADRAEDLRALAGLTSRLLGGEPLPAILERCLGEEPPSADQVAEALRGSR